MNALFSIACITLVGLFVVEFVLVHPLREEQRRRNDGRRLVAEIRRNHPAEVE